MYPPTFSVWCWGEEGGGGGAMGLRVLVSPSFPHNIKPIPFTIEVHRLREMPPISENHPLPDACRDEAEDEAEVCVLCCQKRSTVAVCDECKEHYCTECIDTHTCGTNVFC